MKIIGIYLFLLLLLCAFTLGVDLVLGLDLQDALQQLNPFRVADIKEVMISVVLLLLPIVQPLRRTLSGRKRRRNPGGPGAQSS